MVDISGLSEDKVKPEAITGIFNAIVFLSMNACNFESHSR